MGKRKIAQEDVHAGLHAVRYRSQIIPAFQADDDAAAALVEAVITKSDPAVEPTSSLRYNLVTAAYVGLWYFFNVINQIYNKKGEIAGSDKFCDKTNVVVGPNPSAADIIAMAKKVLGVDARAAIAAE